MTAAPTARAGAAAAARPCRVAAAAAAALVGAAAAHDAFAVRQFVTQTALQTAAHARQLRGVQAQVLQLGHLDGHRLERLEPGRTTQRTPAGSVAAEHTRFVPYPDLTHLDPRPEVRGEIAHQLAEVHTSLRGVIEDEARTVEDLFHSRELHRKTALADLQQADPMRITLALLVFQPCDDVVG